MNDPIDSPARYACRSHRIGRWAVLVLAMELIVLHGCDDGEAPTTVDTEPPRVIQVVPVDAAVAVPVDITVQIVFSESVVIDSTISMPLRIDGPDGPIGGVVALDTTATILSFTPALALPTGIDCRVVLAAGIADQSGNARPDSMTSVFTTGLAFEDIGLIYVASELSQDIRAYDVSTYEEIEESPLVIAGVPVRMDAVPETGELYVLYKEYVGFGCGVLVVDGSTLTVLRDSGVVAPNGAADLVVSPRHDRIYLVSTDDATVTTLDRLALTPVGEPYTLDRPDAEPVRVTISTRFDYLVIGMRGGGRVGAHHLPSLEPVSGFPATATDDVTDITIDDERGQAWVAGSERFAVVDLLNPDRTESFQIPVSGCWYCTPRVWAIVLAPHLDRAILMYRRQALTSVVVSTLEVASESPGDLGLANAYLSDMLLNPRNGELVLLGWGNSATPMYAADPSTLEPIEREMPRTGDRAIDLEVLP